MKIKENFKKVKLGLKYIFEIDKIKEALKTTRSKVFFITAISLIIIILVSTITRYNEEVSREINTIKSLEIIQLEQKADQIESLLDYSIQTVQIISNLDDFSFATNELKSIETKFAQVLKNSKSLRALDLKDSAFVNRVKTVKFDGEVFSRSIYKKTGEEKNRASLKDLYEIENTRLDLEKPIVYSNNDKGINIIQKASFKHDKILGYVNLRLCTMAITKILAEIGYEHHDFIGIFSENSWIFSQNYSTNLTNAINLKVASLLVLNNTTQREFKRDIMTIQELLPKGNKTAPWYIVMVFNKHGVEMNRNKAFKEYTKFSISLIFIAIILAHLIATLVHFGEENRKNLKVQARYDKLTNIPNRRFFKELVDNALKDEDANKEKSTATLFLDLDNFKQVNDIYGHCGGDDLLKTIAQNVKELLRSDDVVARVGGDEFAVLLISLKGDNKAVLKNIYAIASKIKTVINREFICNTIDCRNFTNCSTKEKVMISASIGISVYGIDAYSYEEMLANADKAMYMSKNNGKNSISFFSRQAKEVILDV